MSGPANFTESFDPLKTAKAIGSNIKVVAVFEIHILNEAEANINPRTNPFPPLPPQANSTSDHKREWGCN